MLYHMATAGNSCNNSSLGAAKGSSRPLQHRGNHVASLLAYRQPETLAEQLLAQQEHNNDLQEQLVSTSSRKCARLVASCDLLPYGSWHSKTCLLLIVLHDTHSSSSNAMVLSGHGMHSNCTASNLMAHLVLLFHACPAEACPDRCTPQGGRAQALQAGIAGC
jgi:hypothetical protein